MLAAADPANAYGAALPWPDPPGAATHKPGRKAGALVVLVGGRLRLYVERGGRTLLAWAGEESGEAAEEGAAALRQAVRALAQAVRHGAVSSLTVERINGVAVLADPGWAALLEEAGFHATPRGLRLRP